jgi:magnesium chelatase subunit I
MVTPTTLGELRAAGLPERTVKEELRTNLIARLAAGVPLFSDIVGYDETVVPALERALLAGHDIILLGERGQAKSRLIRRLVDLLDDQVPVIEGCEVNDHPFHPICARCRSVVAERGDETPVAWIDKDDRFAEKLATPDASVADLIGDVDPIRVAEGRYLSDALTIHYGLVPRTNRGIFAINELPDLPERIQVALLNILEERDVQVRGYKIRLPLDLLLIASANPEDYTHRGRIITPLKDRFGSEVRTHYPTEIEHEIAIMEQEASPPPVGRAVRVPRYLIEVLAELTAQLRADESVSRRSGVSVRFSIGNLESIRASALRRALRSSESEAVARMIDVWSVLPSSIGRIEFDTLDEGREPEIVARALRGALLEVWHRRLSGHDFSSLVSFDDGRTVEITDLTSAHDLLTQFGSVEATGAGAVAARLGVGDDAPGEIAGALEFALEGLHLTRRLNKLQVGPAAVFGI